MSEEKWRRAGGRRAPGQAWHAWSAPGALRTTGCCPQGIFLAKYYTLENVRLYTLPDQPPIMIAASGPRSAQLAGRIGDGFIGPASQADLRPEFERAGGAGRPRYGQITVCWAPDEATAKRTTYAWWPNAAIKGALSAERQLPILPARSPAPISRPGTPGCTLIRDGEARRPV